MSPGANGIPTDAERAAPDLIHLEVVGRADGSTRGLHRQRGHRISPRDGLTRPAGTGEPRAAGLGRQLWAVRGHRGPGRCAAATARAGHGAIRLPLDDVALATAANLGFLTEVMVTGTQRPRLGNAIYGQYGQNFPPSSNDGAWFMVVALTNRHFRDLTERTGTTKRFAAVAEAFGADFTDEGRQRYEHRGA